MIVIKRKLYSVSPINNSTHQIKQTFDISKPGAGKLNKSLKRDSFISAGAKAGGISKFISIPSGKTVQNAMYNSGSVLNSGRSINNNLLSQAQTNVMNANLGKGKATVHDRINLRASQHKGDHVDLENTFAFNKQGFKPIRNLDKGYGFAFGQEIIGAKTSFKDNKALQNLGVVSKPNKWWQLGKKY
jgi:hypothetical protein